MENITANAFGDIMRTLAAKANTLSENVLEELSFLENTEPAAQVIDFEVGKKGASLKLEIDRGKSVESITWQIKGKSR